MKTAPISDGKKDDTTTSACDDKLTSEGGSIARANHATDFHHGDCIAAVIAGAQSS